jgi:hypothetical protein
MANRDPLDIQDYLDASSDASKRTRTITIILVIASVVVLAGWLNSLQTHWMQKRMIMLQDMRGEYVASKLGPYPEYKVDGETYKHETQLYEQRYKDLCAAVERAYVDNSLVVRVPFLGFTFDVNDLGLIGGIGFLVILACYRFFLSREVDNLRLSFEEASRLGEGELEKFYSLLAMRQVFTVPVSTHIKRTPFLVVAPKLICWFPLLVYLLVTFNDWRTLAIGEYLDKFRFWSLFSFELLTSVCIAILSVEVTIRLVRMDGIWEQYGGKIVKAPSPPLAPPIPGSSTVTVVAGV